MDEEELMLKYKYPRMIDHVREHNLYFVRFFTHTEREYSIFDLDIAAVMTDKSRRTALFLSEFAAGWLEKHIYARDKLLAEHLKKRM